MSAREVPWFAVINLGNSIIGVSILAMPWCFRECGVILATTLIIFGGFMTRLSCNLLLRASKATRRQSYEFLAYHTLGATGKLAVEMSIIGLLLCTCIAFFTIMGDLGPAIVSKWGGFENNWELRAGLLVFIAAAIVMPLGLRRSVESLGSISTVSILFYVLFSSDIVWNSLPMFTSGTWSNDLVLWRPAGTLKGLSIFALAFSCQTVLFVVYDSIPEKTPKQMESVVNRAVAMVGMTYIIVGFFGYVTFKKSGIKGDILLNFAPGIVSEVLRLGFTLSVALSFPLVIFPCRASIYTLFFSHAHSLENPHGGGSGAEYIPPSMFKLITLILVVFTLILGIVIPNVEVILGLTGATLGCLICFIFPALIYLRTSGVPNKGTGKIVLTVGVFLLICSTYDNLQSMQQEADIDIPRLDIEDEVRRLEIAANQLSVNKGDGLQDADENHKPDDKQIEDIEKEPKVIKDHEEEVLKPDKKDERENESRKDDADQEVDEGKEKPKEAQVINEHRKEPPIPHAPADDDVKAKPLAKDAFEEDNDDTGNEARQEQEGDVERDIDREQEKNKKIEHLAPVDGDESNRDKEEKEEEKDPKAREDEKEDEPHKKADDDETNLDKMVEDKVIEQEHRQEEQDKQLKEIKDTEDESLEKIVQDKVVEQELKQGEQDKQLKELKKETADQASLEKINEVLEQEQRQEEHDKEIKEIKEKQDKQEEIIKLQAEELDRLRIQHEEEQKEKEKEKLEKEREEREKLLKEKEEAERKAKQDALLQQQEELQRKQQELQKQQEQQQQQQQQQQLPAGGFQGQGGLGQDQFQQPVGGGIGMEPVNQVPQHVPQDGFAGDLGLQQQQQQQQQQFQPGLGDGMGGGLQQQPVLDGGVLQQQQQMPIVGQQPAAIQQQVLQPQQGVMQQQAGVIGQQGVAGQAIVQQQVGGQMPVQDGGLNMQQGMQGGMDQFPGQVVQQQQQGIPQQVLDRQQRSLQDGVQVDPGMQQQLVGIPQQGMADGGLSQGGNLQQQQNLQLVNQQQNLPQQQMVPMQGNNFQQQGQVPLNPDSGLQQGNQMLQQQQQQQLNQGAIVQQQQPIDQQVPILEKKRLDQDFKPIIPVGIDSNAANRQLKNTDSKQDHDLKQEKVRNTDLDKMERKRTKQDQDVNDDDDTLLQGEAKDLKQDEEEGKVVEVEKNEDEHQVLVDDKEDQNMELANSLDQQLNNQFKQVGVIAKQGKTKTHDDVKTNTRNKEDMK
ncbi:uncharacterized protein [Amphiura filiformis]|uniref:uncharacterized protein isoform X5 n=1 Tax=Amphiura filiformis TaxID=82378 RepID=UPI003B220DD3